MDSFRESSGMKAVDEFQDPRDRERHGASRRFVARTTAVICLLTLGNIGCASLDLDLGAPGTIGMQRERAVIHDPYPSPDLGPEIVGGRPAGYRLPLAPAKSLQVNPYARTPSRTNRGAFAQPYTGF